MDLLTWKRVMEKYYKERRNVGASVLQSLPNCNTRKTTKRAQEVRDAFANHFWGPEQIPWEWKMI